MKILLLGASGNVAQEFIKIFNEKNDDTMEIIFFLRNKNRLPVHHQQSGVEIFEGDMSKSNSLIDALSGVTHIVSLVGSSPMPTYASELIEAIKQVTPPLEKIVWLGAGGMNHETTGVEGGFWRAMPGYFNQQLQGAKMIQQFAEENNIRYTIISPVMFRSGGEKQAIVSSSTVQTDVQRVSRATTAGVFFEALSDHFDNEMITVGDTY